MSTLLKTNFNDPFDSYTGLPSTVGAVQTSRVENYPGVISAVNKLTYDTVEVVVKYEGTAFIMAQAGQYGTLKVNGIERARAYSFAKSPHLENKNEVTFFIRYVDGGEMSNWLQQQNRVGEKVTVGGPMGKFALDSSDKTIVCIAGGSGMTGIKALVEQAASDSIARDCMFFYGARTQADLYCLDEMEAVASQWNSNNKFTFIPVLSEEPADSDWKGPRGFVTQHLKEQYLDRQQLNVDNIKAFFCGPPAMIDHGVGILKTSGLSDADIRFDKFEDMSSPAPVIDNAKCTLCDECMMVKPVANCIVESGNHTVHQGKVTTSPVIPGVTSGLYYNTLFINSDSCIRCYACVDACPHDAISASNLTIPNILRKLD
jgi:NAD(P)H-flavin reductase